MVSKRNHHSIVPFFNNHSPPPRQFLRYKIRLKKKLGEMLIEQIIEFDLRGPGALEILPPPPPPAAIENVTYDKNVVKKLEFFQFQFLLAFFAYNAFF